MHLSTRHIALAAVSAAVTAGACSRDDEAAMRARLSPWFGLGETLAFAARSDCAAAAFRLVHGGIGASMAVEASVPEMLRALPGRGAAAVDDPQLAPDTVMVEAANAERAIGMAMRRASLEARACMDDRVEGAFRQVLVNPRAILAYDPSERAVMLMDRDAGLLIVAMGAKA